MASIVTRKSNFAVVYWYVNDNNERKQKWDTLTSKKEAQARKAFIEYYQKTHGYVLVPNEQEVIIDKEELLKQTLEEKEDDITFGEFLDVFVNLYGTSKWSVSTFSSKTAEINNYIIPYIGDCKLTDLTTKKLTQYYHSLLSVPEVPKANRFSRRKNVI